MVAIKMIRMCIRSSFVHVLLGFLHDRKIKLKRNQNTSYILDLVGGGPQGSLIGQLLYVIGSDDVAEEVLVEA